MVFISIDSGLRALCLTIQSYWGLELGGSELREMASDQHDGASGSLIVGKREVGSRDFVDGCR